ncbi:intermembrane transport protein PqiB [Arsenophonus nasoniae]|uniref:Intermembrane transport protein PqiB n=1 Tax=Arsenophonus nasoniae TaxID=638 RepID=A0AA95GH21_9GAMM|nr:intermembrane transport protein PqiB [Arsenophonus nasoniae]WGL96175.1 intermembrane transport protein PqiB [Arsenophonus nasoniae]
MANKDNTDVQAKISKLKSWSPIWIIPIITIFIGAWILIYHFSHLGPQVTLITYNAEGVEAGKTKLKSRSVDIGLVENVSLDKNFKRVIIKARLNDGMSDLLKKDTAFWIVKPAIGKEGITGLGTLFSGVFIEVQPGNSEEHADKFDLLGSPPLASPDAKGIRVILTSDQAGRLNMGAPVLFHGYRVGSVEASSFDIKSRNMHYQLFINAPYDGLVTENVRFWRDSGIALDLSAQGVRLDMGSLTTLFSGGVSFDVVEGWQPGKRVEDKSLFRLYEDQKSIQNSLYTVHKDFVLFFTDSVRGLQPGAPVEFRGIRLGTVMEVPFDSEKLRQKLDNEFRIPVLIHIEPGRVSADIDLEKEFAVALRQGLRAALKSANLITGALYIDLDFYPEKGQWKGPLKVADYDIIPTVSAGLSQIQQKVVEALDKINRMPIEPMISQATNTLAESQKTIREAQRTLSELNKLMTSKDFQNIPADLQQTLFELNRVMQGLQPGSPAYNRMLDNMQRLDQVLRDIQPVIKTLNNKSNALIFEAKPMKDPEPKKVTK